MLCDSIRKGDTSFAYTVFHTFLNRVDERVKTIDELLARSRISQRTRRLSFDRERPSMPATPGRSPDRWRKRIKYDLLVLKTGRQGREERGQGSRDKLTRRYHSFDKRMHQTNSDELLEMYLNAFTMSFDPHTDYMSPKTQQNFDIAMGLDLEGIGASLDERGRLHDRQEDHPRRRRR